jgi:hypothetical protein
MSSKRKGLDEDALKTQHFCADEFVCMVHWIGKNKILNS